MAFYHLSIVEYPLKNFMHFSSPSYHQQEEFCTRSAKLAAIRALKIEPYPHFYKPTTSAHALFEKYGEKQEIGHSEEAAQGLTEEVCLAGRLVLFRPMGKNAFAQIQDGSTRIQVMFNREHIQVDGLSPQENLENSPMKFIEKKLDIGDIIGVRGNVFRTQKGELTIFVKTLTLLCKSLLPLPEKHSGLVDKGVRYRKRWLDLISHPEELEHFRLRFKIIQKVRSWLESQGFLEVETPILQNVYGGASARPFHTHLHALDQNMFLRISLEIPLKKLIVGGFQKVFELSKVFRNEGIDRTHNPEFTELEVYAAYWDYNDMMVLTENLFEHIALDLLGSTKLLFKQSVKGEEKEVTVDLKAPWKRISMVDSLKEYASIDVDSLSTEELGALLKKKTDMQPSAIEQMSRGLRIASLFEECVESHLIQPHHIIDHPIETTPLCKLHRNSDLCKKGFVERFESFILGQEFSNSYTELNDPELQRTLLLEQAEKRLAGDEEASPLDEDFIEAICQGMPPTGGLGIGIDRLIMLLTKAHSIRDVLFFPLMRPEE